MEILPYYFISYNCLNKKYKSFYSKIKNLEFDKVADCELYTRVNYISTEQPKTFINVNVT